MIPKKEKATRTNNTFFRFLLNTSLHHHSALVRERKIVGTIRHRREGEREGEQSAKNATLRSLPFLFFLPAVIQCGGFLLR